MGETGGADDVDSHWPIATRLMQDGGSCACLEGETLGPIGGKRESEREREKIRERKSDRRPRGIQGFAQLGKSKLSRQKLNFWRSRRVVRNSRKSN